MQGLALTNPQIERLGQLDRQLGELPQDLLDASARGRQVSLDRATELKAILALSPDKLQTNFIQQLAKTQAQLAACEKRIGELQREKQGNATEVSAAEREHAQGVLAMRQLTIQITTHLNRANLLARSSYGKTVKEEVDDYKREKQKDGTYEKVFKGTKTVTRKLPETADETARRIGDIQGHRAAAVNKGQAKDILQSQLKDHLKEKNALTSDAAKFKNTVAGEWDALHVQLRELRLQQSRIETWQQEPKTFAAYIRTIDPYVPWDVEVLRDQLLESMTLTDPGPARLPSPVVAPRQ